MQQDKKRIDYIDITKGIAIFLVVWGHVIQVGGAERDFFQDKLFTFIYSFHMPLFMILSGYVFAKTIQRKVLRENIRNKLTRLVIPAVCWGILYYAVKIIIENYLLDGHYSFSISGMVQEIENVWFLWSVFCCTMIVLFAEQIKNKVFAFLFYFSAVVILYYIPNGELHLFLFPYFLIGYIWGKKEKISFMFGCVCILLFPILLSYYSKEHYIYVSGITRWCDELGVGRQISIDIFRWGIGLAGSFFIITLVRWITKEVSSDNKICKAFKELGKYTLEIYVMQRILVEYMGAKVLWKIVNEMGLPLLSHEIVYDYGFTLLFAVFFTTVLFFIAIYYRKGINRLKQKLQ